MAYDKLLKKMVADAIINKVAGLNIKVDFKLFVSAGVYDPETDTEADVYTTVTDVVVVEVAPTVEDVSSYSSNGVTAKSKKLLVPGISVPREPNNETDKVIIAGKEWNIKKVVGVPGGSLYKVFVNET